MSKTGVTCSNCGWGFDYAKIIGPIYQKYYVHASDEYWKRREQVENSDKRLQKYKKETVNEPEVNFERLKKEDSELFKQFQSMLDEQDEIENLETSYITDGKLLLSKGECPNCDRMGTLKFSPK